MKLNGKRVLGANSWASSASACKIPLYPPFEKGEISCAQFLIVLPLFKKACPEPSRREGPGEICLGRKVRAPKKYHSRSRRSFPVGDSVAIRKNPSCVMLSGAKHLVFSVTREDEILRLSPQDDIATQSPQGEKVNILVVLSRLNRGLCVLMVLGLLLLTGLPAKDGGSAEIRAPRPQHLFRRRSRGATACGGHRRERRIARR